MAEGDKPHPRSESEMGETGTTDKQIPGFLVGRSDDAPGRKEPDRRPGQILGTLAAFGLLGLIYMLNEYAPGAMGAPRFYDRGVSYYKEFNNLEAKQAFSRAIQLDSTFDKAYFARAVVNWRLDDANEAIDDYTSVIRLKPGHVDAFHNRGLIYQDIGDPEHALADFDAVVRLKPDGADGYRRRAAIYRGLGDYTRALADYDTLMRLDGSYLPYYRERAALRREAGDLAGAIADLDAALAIGQYIETYLQRALLRREAVDMDGALADFDRAVALKPDDLRGTLGRGETLQLMGRTDDAKAEFDAAIARDAKNATGYLQRGALALFRLGEPAAAAADLDAAVHKGIEYRNFRRLIAAGARYAETHFDIASTQLDVGPLIAPEVPFVPSIYYAIVWRHIASRRARQDDTIEFADARSRLTVDFWRTDDLTASAVRTHWRRRVIWPGHIVALFAGKATPDIVRQAAEAAPGPYERQQRLCEANFYVAEYRLLAGATDEGLAQLQAAAADCPAGMAATDFAKSELERLGAQQ